MASLQRAFSHSALKRVLSLPSSSCTSLARRNPLPKHQSFRLPLTRSLHSLRSCQSILTRAFSTTTTTPPSKETDPLSSTPSPKQHAAEAQIIFDGVISRIEKRYGRSQLWFPKEIMWLAGAPGAGKGTMTPFIMKERGYTSPPIETSRLLNTPAAEKLKEQGLMVGDREVVELLIEELLKEKYNTGVIVDGFPRTAVQAECVKLLYDFMLQLHKDFPNNPNFHRPTIHVTVLYIDENESVRRQLNRGKVVKAHNVRVKETGVGFAMDARPTDENENLARLRYAAFKEQVQTSLAILKDRFNFHFVNADGSIDEVQERMSKEFVYQSSLELGDETFSKIRVLPLASEITMNARQNLVRRLESYQANHSQLLTSVIEVMQREFFHIIKRQALAGRAIIRSENPIFDEPIAVDMALDLLAERGFIAVLDVSRQKIPESVDTTNNKIIFKKKRIFQFHIEFPRPVIRSRLFS